MRSRRIPGTFYFAVCFLISAGLLTLMMTVFYIVQPSPDVRHRLFLTFLLVGLVICGLLYKLFLRRSNTIRDIQKSIEFFSSGYLQHRIRQPGVWELRDLVYSINSMASELNSRMETIREQRNELAVLFEGMTDGMLAVNMGGRIMDINDALCSWLGLEPELARGKSLHEITRNRDIQRIVLRMLDKKEPMELSFTLTGSMDRHLEARGSLLKKDDEVNGVLIMFRDTTRLRQLESIRTDFVANVSHELKTPITSIKGYAETLADLEGNENPTRDRFLQIIINQSNRLYAIVEDLLSLSRLEQQHEKLSKEMTDIRRIIEVAVQSRSGLAEEKNTTVVVDAAEATTLPLNSSLMEQALVNLIENAIKYSPENTTVHVRAQRKENLLTLRISDQGPGIPLSEQERIFERFYRIDKGRSRDMGGTGLGLAIVKHIVRAHDGHISVESFPGQGTTFILNLPCPQQTHHGAVERMAS